MNRRPDSEFFVVDSPVRGHYLKQRMIQAGFEYRCATCRIGPEWNGEPLTLQVDHENGTSSDNRRGNLRFLCPNCHAQTKTFAGKRVLFVACPAGCGARIRAGSLRCRECRRWLTDRYGARDEVPAPALGTFRADWPAASNLLDEVRRTSFSAVGRRLGVSDNAVRKHLRNRGLLP